MWWGDDAIALFKETVAHYNRDHTDIHWAMVGLFKAYDRIYISSVCDKLKATCLSEQLFNLIEFTDKKTFFCTSYEWKLGNAVGQGVSHMVSF